jgi:hypothetical protein
MQFMLSLVGEEPDFSQIDPAEMQRTIDAMGEYNEKLAEAGALLMGGGLQQRDQSRTIRFEGEGDSVVTDGPFAETKEQLAGFWIIEAAGIDEATEWARRAPVAEGGIEIRPFAHELDLEPVPAETDSVTAEELLEGVQGKGNA